MALSCSTIAGLTEKFAPLRLKRRGRLLLWARWSTCRSAELAVEPMM